MTDVVKKGDVQKLYPQRNPRSRKGENGRVLIIGGSIDYFGAPILAGLGALGSGSDLAYLLVPECNFDVTRSFYPDFIVRKYPGDFLNNKAVEHAAPLLPKVDCVLIGPGMSENPESLNSIVQIIKQTQCDIVLDAEAIPAIARLELFNRGREHEFLERLTITPHRGEMDELLEEDLPADPREEIKVVEKFANSWGITILLKSPRDIIASPGRQTRVNETGNAGMTVGGSGDVLAGFTASLIAQKLNHCDACKCAAFLFGLTGDNLYKQKGYNYMATDLALELPYTIKSIIG